jgi:hypothetical protein
MTSRFPLNGADIMGWHSRHIHNYCPRCRFVDSKRTFGDNILPGAVFPNNSFRVASTFICHEFTFQAKTIDSKMGSIAEARCGWHHGGAAEVDSQLRRCWHSRPGCTASTGAEHLYVARHQAFPQCWGQDSQRRQYDQRGSFSVAPPPPNPMFVTTIHNLLTLLFLSGPLLQPKEMQCNSTKVSSGVWFNNV